MKGKEMKEMNGTQRTFFFFSHNNQQSTSHQQSIKQKSLFEIHV